MAEPKTYTEDEYNAMIAERDALKANRDEVLKEAKSAKEKLKNYDGVDPVEFKRLKDEAAAAEAKKLAAEGDFNALKKQLVDAHTVELAAKDTRAGKLEKSLNKHLVEAKLAAALAKADADPSMIGLLMLEGQRHVRVRETDDGFEEYVSDDAGNPRVADGKGTAMDVDTFVAQTLKTTYPGAFKGTGSSGGGASKSNAGGGGAKTVAVGDDAAFLANLDGIAKGEVVVQ